jgi:DNA adenine methylase
MLGFMQKSEHVDFQVADFIHTMKHATLGDVVYCDPPYVPLNETSSFTSYTHNGFNLLQQEQLAELAIELMHKGITVIISNHDTTLTRSLYAKADITYFDVQRFISSNALNRNKAPELLAVFKGSII